jgi:hypothetical protein
LILTDKDPQRFMHGYCYILASALWHFYGGEVYIIYMYYPHEGKMKKSMIGDHAYLFYKNKYWDIEGSHIDTEKMLKRSTPPLGVKAVYKLEKHPAQMLWGKFRELYMQLDKLFDIEYKKYLDKESHES